MRERSKTYTAFVCGALCVFVVAHVSPAQSVDSDRNTCAAILSNDSSVGARLGPGLSDSTGRRPDTSARVRPDSASLAVGGARSGPADIMLLVGVHADEVRFGSQPHLRVRLCWGGDTLRVVQRDNLPSPVVPGTTYRNVYIAVELIGRVNAECLASQLGLRDAQPQGAQRNPQVTAPASAGSCAFLGGAATGGAQNPRPPTQ